ncbi:acyltransferase domain-containing protein [Spirochaetota bacterium]
MKCCPFEIFDHDWEGSVASFPGAACETLKDIPLLTASCSFCGFDTAAVEDIKQTASLISENDELLLLFWHCYRLLYITMDYTMESIKKWPLLSKELKDKAGIFYLLLAIAAVPEIRKKHSELNIPENITRETVYEFKLMSDQFGRMHNNELGILPDILIWLRTHASGRLFALGRFQFLKSDFSENINVFRNNNNSTVLALSGSGVDYTSTGFCRVSGHPGDSEGAWKSEYTETEKHYSGHPILPTGTACRCTIKLQRPLWEKVLTSGSSVIEVHIPEGGKMDLESCIHSMKDAIDFYKKYYPNEDFKGFVCKSWIMNPEYRKIYRPNANFVLFQEELYLYPLPSNGKAGLLFIFDSEDIDTATAPRDTSIRRAMAEHRKKGGMLRIGGMFFLKEDMDMLGKKHYQNQDISKLIKGS